MTGPFFTLEYAWPHYVGLVEACWYDNMYCIYSDKSRTFVTWILAYILPATYTRNIHMCFHEPEKYERITQTAIDAKILHGLFF